LKIDPFDLYRTDERDWQRRLDYIVETMREISLHEDPQEMVTTYSRRMRQTLPSHRFLSLSRRGVEPPRFVVARDLDEGQADAPAADVWRHRDRLPVLEGGLLGRLIYANAPAVIEDLEADPDDPGFAYLRGYRSLTAIPVFDRGESMNMIVLLRREPNGFDKAKLPQMIWTSNLFGRATHNLVLRRQLAEAYDLVDREMRVIAEIQESLLPDELPAIPTLDLAVYYEPAARAGGDYYDFFPLDDDRWGVLVADVSGHGSPAAVHMAITHTLAHTRPNRGVEPGRLLEYVNHHLARKYNLGGGTFVTAFFGVYDPGSRELTYASAGHPPPQIKRCADGTLFALDAVGGVPMGILDDERYEQTTATLTPGDQMIFYTDGITEAMNGRDELFGRTRLAKTLENCSLDAQGLIDEVLATLRRFTGGVPAADDQTLLVAKVR